MIQKVSYSYENITENSESKTIIAYLQVHDSIKLKNTQHMGNYSVLLNILKSHC